MADAEQCVGKHATSNLQAYIDDLYNVIELMCSCDLIMISAIVAHLPRKCSAHEPKGNNAMQRRHAHRPNGSHRAADWWGRKQVHCILTMMGVP